MDIRRERASDIPAIRAVTVAAFANCSYGHNGEAEIVDALRADGALAISLVADRKGDILGHVAFSPVGFTDGGEGWFGLGPVSVRPAEQGKGLGRSLIEAGLERLRAMDAGGCVVLGSPDYYARFGFMGAPALSFQGVSSPYLQQLILGGPPGEGEVRYHPAFG